MTYLPAGPDPEFASPTDATAASTAERAQHTTRPWFKKKRFLLPLALVVLVVVIQAAYGGGDRWAFDTAESTSQPTITISTNAGAGAGAAAAKIGTIVKDGTFEFVVTAVERPGKTLAGKVGETLTANGEFVIVRVDVTNIGQAAQSADCQCQVLLNDKGQRFRPSLAILSTKEALKFVKLIEPGSTVKSVLVLFDVTPGTKVANIELHGSPSTQGAMVKLS